MRYLFALALLTVLLSSARAEVVGKEVDYTQAGTTLKGYLAYDDALEGKRPGVLVVHEWWGHNPYARQRARDLAALGYTALAVDMYGEGKQAEHPKDAGKFAGAVRENAEVATARFTAAMQRLKAEATVDASKLGAIGYCFGGSVVLNMARWGVDLDGVVSFHGSPATTKEAATGDVKAKILVCHGADDNFIPQEQIDAFKAEMDAAGADYTFKAYEGAKHSFTNPDADAMAEKFGIGIAYNADADQQSWSDMKAFFEDVFAVDAE